jgi:hypothetical protein
MEHPVDKKIEAINSGTVRRMKKVDDTVELAMSAKSE